MDALLGLLVIVFAVWLVVRTKRRGSPGRVNRAKEVTVAKVELSPDGRQGVAGESHYQKALKAAAGGKVVPEREPDKAIPVEATLVPDGNRHDRNAVRVVVNGHTVGHLPREDAADYRPELNRLWQEGAVGVCPGRIMGGGKRHYGIHLRLAPPGRARRANSADGLRVVGGGQSVAVSQLSDHQDVIEAALADWPPDDDGSYPPFVCELAEGVVASGKHEGKLSIEVRLNGQRIGELSQKMTNRYWHLLDGTPVGCEATIKRKEDDALNVRVKLPETVN
jgi:hypothetical protein